MKFSRIIPLTDVKVPPGAWENIRAGNCLEIPIEPDGLPGKEQGKGLHNFPGKIIEQGEIL
jgi:hypothetical protein